MKMVGKNVEMERAMLEQQARADQATAALQARQVQQQQTAASAQQAPRRWAAAQNVGIGASTVVDTRFLGKCESFRNFVMCLHGLDILSMWVLFFSLLCATASAFQYSHLAKDLEVFVANRMDNPRSCSAGVDEMRVLELFVFFVPTMFSGILGSFVENSTVVSFSLFGLHTNILGSMCC